MSNTSSEELTPRVGYSHTTPEKFQLLAEAGVVAEREKLGLTELVEKPCLKLLAEGTINAYEKHTRLLKHFCALVGDYESLIILQHKVPDHFCPSINPETIAMVIRYKEEKMKGKDLRNCKGKLVCICVWCIFSV